MDCGNKMAQNDGHNSCVVCLGESHNSATCSTCNPPTPKTRDSRAVKPKANPWEKSVKSGAGDSGAKPPVPPVEPSSEPTPSTSKGSKRLGRSPAKEKRPKKKSKDKTPASRSPTASQGSHSKVLAPEPKQSKTTKDANPAESAKNKQQTCTEQMAEPGEILTPEVEIVHSSPPSELSPRPCSRESSGSSQRSRRGQTRETGSYRERADYPPPWFSFPFPPSMNWRDWDPRASFWYGSSGGSSASPARQRRSLSRGRSHSRRKSSSSDRSRSRRDRSPSRRRRSSSRISRGEDSTSHRRSPFRRDSMQSQATPLLHPPKPRAPEPAGSPASRDRRHQDSSCSSRKRQRSGRTPEPQRPAVKKHQAAASVSPASSRLSTPEDPPHSPRRRATSPSAGGMELSEPMDQGSERDSLQANVSNDKIGDSSGGSSSEDLRVMAEQIIKMGQALKIDCTPIDLDTDDPIMGILKKPTAGSVAIPLVKGVKDALFLVWENPSSTSASSKRLEALYKVKESEAVFLLKHPRASSILSAVLPSKNRADLQTSPSDKEGRKLDLMGRKIYASGAMGARVVNLQAVMARYQTYLWEGGQEFKEYIPQDMRAKYDAWVTEGHRIALQQLNAARHSADCLARSMATGIALRRYSWLRSSSLSSDLKLKLEDLPFDGIELFGQQTDEELEKMRKYRLAAKTLGITTGQPSHTRSRPWRRQPSNYPYYRYSNPREYRYTYNPPTYRHSQPSQPPRRGGKGRPQGQGNRDRPPRGGGQQ